MASTHDEEVAGMLADEENAKRNLALYEARRKPPQPPELKPMVLPDTDDLKELYKAALPQMARRTIEMAYKSENPAQLLASVKELTDRILGKAEQAVTQTITVRKEISDEELARRLIFNMALVEDKRRQEGLPPLAGEIIDVEPLT